jgi:hypothetical protein
MQEGRVWKPRASTLDVTENAIDANLATNPANLDGDHVLIGFLNDRLNEPVILRGLPHPAGDTGQEDESAGHRMRLKVADGDPDIWKHRGAFYGISNDGDFVVDLTQAYAAELGADGKQPTPPDDGSTGNYSVTAQKKAEVRLKVDGGKSVFVKETELALGEENPVQKVLLGTLFRTAQATLNTALNTGWTALSTVFTALAAAFTALAADPLLAPATKTACTTAAAACTTAATASSTTATAINTFENTASSNQDFQSNTTKTAL